MTRLGGTEPGRPLMCPTCAYKPGFTEIPMWQHIGYGAGNIAAIMKLDLYKVKPE